MTDSSIAAGMPANWKELTPAQKRKWRLDRFLTAENVKFVNEEAKKAYRVRAQRMVDVYNVREPDRVPVVVPVGDLPLDMAGLNLHTAMYEPDKSAQAYMKFNERYAAQLEHFAVPMTFPGRVCELLDYKIYAWPGCGLPDNAPGWQYIEGEYMRDDEYDDLIRDPSDFWLRTYLPRVFGVFEMFKAVAPLTDIWENVNIANFIPLGTEKAQESLQRLLKVGQEYERYNKAVAGLAGGGNSRGFPVLPNIFCKAPFDTLGDTLRGTKGIINDMFRRPDKLLKALDVIADLGISSVLKNPGNARFVTVHYPLHKGADGWMSQRQFDTFYWAPLKKMMNAFINEGLIQFFFAEGGYNTRLGSIGGFPKGAVAWYFDKTDMALAKKALGKDCCIQGNVPSSLVVTGTPKEVKENCRKLIEECGPGGGYVLTSGAVGSIHPKIDNLIAMVEAAKEYGTYKK